MKIRWLTCLGLSLGLWASKAVAEDGWRPVNPQPPKNPSSTAAVSGACGVSLGRPVAMEAPTDLFSPAETLSNFTRTSHQNAAVPTPTFRFQSPELTEPVPILSADNLVNVLAPPLSPVAVNFAYETPATAEPPVSGFPNPPGMVNKTEVEMYRNRPILKKAAGWLGSCMLLAGCQSPTAPAPNSVAPIDFFEAKSHASNIRLASSTGAEPPLAQDIEGGSSKTQNRGSKVNDAESDKVSGTRSSVPDLRYSTPDASPLDPQPMALPCHSLAIHGLDGGVPRELSKVVIPDYIIEPPDILLVEAIPSLPDQPVQGEHLVRPDGTINLGTYGSVRVAGLTLDQARAVIKDQLAVYIKNVKLNVDVFAYNSKVIYVIADGAGFGQPMFRIPFTGNDTVLDAISQIGGLPATASKKKIWVARPGPDDSIQTMPVDWKAITQDGLTRTNYQLFPGDRIFIQSDRLMALDGVVTKIVTPIERVFGVTYLGAQTIFRLQNMGRGAGGSGGSGL